MKCSRARQDGEGEGFNARKAAAAVALGSLMLGAGALEFGGSPYLQDCGCTGENAAVYAPISRPPRASASSLSLQLGRPSASGAFAGAGGLAMASSAPAARAAAPAASPLPLAGSELSGARLGRPEDPQGPGLGSMRPFDGGSTGRELLAALPPLTQALAPRLAAEPAPALPAAAFATAAGRGEKLYSDAPEISGRETERALVPFRGGSGR